MFFCLRPKLDPITEELGVDQAFMSEVVVPWKKARKAKAPLKTTAKAEVSQEESEAV